ncbi:aldose epimerase family protein [Caldinitratiruptor microaerophilus]|uniref:DUF5107 domain-containing protein n=1 Tax=Caldinitratiruptor microaerophilus TaxID=671077 RepID=UPI00222EB97F|nr:DUF5107 domain-containing protein [Caldinitratiruptor microaerophilus]
MTARVETGWSYLGHDALILENEFVRVVLLPGLGGKIWELTDKVSGRQWLWHSPRVEPRAAPFGAVYDDWFCGGWDELFPNDAPEVYNGESLVDHGEVWSLPWTACVECAGPVEAVVRLTRATPITPAMVERRLVLRTGERQLRLFYQISNTGYRPFDFLWKLHPALSVAPGYRIDLPATEARMEQGYTGRVGHAEPFPWPVTDGLDVRHVPGPEAGVTELVYTYGLRAGWCALTDPEALVGIGLVFPSDVFRSVWIFGAYGGWRGLYTTILEPCTGYPYRLADAVASGRANRLAPGESLKADVTVVFYSGVHEVYEITDGGEVKGCGTQR